MTIALCFLPLILCFVIYTLGFKIKLTNQLIATLLGLIAVFPISVIQYLLPPFTLFEQIPVLNTLLKSIIIYGFIEELIKFLFLIPIPSKNLSEFEYLLLSFMTGLVLGCFESAVYFLDHMQIAASRGAQLLLSQIFVISDRSCITYLYIITEITVIFLHKKILSHSISQIIPPPHNIDKTTRKGNGI